MKKLLEKKGIIKDDCFSIILPEMMVQDIDTLNDWKLAELKYQLLRNERKK